MVRREARPGRTSDGARTRSPMEAAHSFCSQQSESRLRKIRPGGKGHSPKETHPNPTSQTQTDPVARKLAEDQTKNTDLEVAIPHSSPKEETQEEDRNATKTVSSFSPAESLGHLLESFGDALGPWKLASMNTLPSPCLLCEANRD